MRIGAHDGIAGATFRTGELTNIPLAYQDPRFDPSIDWQIGYRTRNILCAPIFSADGQRLGVLQVVNKRHGAFDSADESHLRSLASQMGVTLDYTALFDQVLRMKSHNESMLRSLTNGVLTIDMRGEVTFANQAALAILRRSEAELLGLPLMKVFGEMNAWILEAIDEVANGRAEKQLPNSEFYIESAGEWVSANISLLPLLDSTAELAGLHAGDRESRGRARIAPHHVALPVERGDRPADAGFRRGTGRHRRRPRPRCSPTSAASPRSPSSWAPPAPCRC